MKTGGGRHQVLVVEDDVALREMMESHLRKGRFEVRCEESAEALLGDLRTGELEYDLALVDIHLPGMSGVELTRLLQAARPLSGVIVITGDADTDLAREALSGGASGYLLKPFQLFELDAAVSQAISMAEMVETTETLARAQSQRLNDWGESGGALPRSWLHVGDEKTGAGPGHGARVVSIAGLLAKRLGEDRLDARKRDLLRTAARTHEIGRMAGGGSQRQVAQRSAKLLDNLGFDPDVCEIVRQAAEEWSPGLSLAARVLALADRVDHDACAAVAAGEEPEEAIHAAVDDILAAAGDRYDPLVAERLAEQREQVESMWVLQQQVAPR